MGGFSQNFISDLKQKVTLSDFVKSAVTWDKKKSSAARQDWWAPCPFHYEKSASFHVDDRKGFYHCFGCGAHGSVVDWLMEYQKLSFVEIMKELCEITNTQMPEFSKDYAQKNEQRKSLYQLMQDAQEFFVAQLYAPNGQEALNYMLHKRGIQRTYLEKYGIGFAPNQRFALLDYLKSKGYETNEAIASGLVIMPEDHNDRPYDRFRNRILFPVKNAQGKIITYGGRALNKDARAKYLNGSETEIFKKSASLYNIDKIAHHRGAIKHFIVTEGYMDVIALGIGGFNNCVAPMGTALTEDQIKLIWRYHNTPILCFDGDQAGMDAACRAAHRVLEILTAGFSLQFCFLPSGLDPDDFIKQKGKEAFQEVLTKAMPLSAVLFAKAVENCPPTTPEMQAGLEKELLSIANKIPDERLKKLYQSDFFKRLNQLTTSRPDFKKTTKKIPYYLRDRYQHSHAFDEFQKEQKNNSIDSLEHIELMILGFFIRFGAYIGEAEFDMLAKINFNNKERKKLRQEILNLFIKNKRKKLENDENIPIISSEKIDSEIDSIWQLPSELRHSEQYRRTLLATESIKMTLNLPFINHSDRINYLSSVLRNGLFDMYYKIISKKQISNSLSELASIPSIEEEVYERFLTLSKNCV